MSIKRGRIWGVFYFHIMQKRQRQFLKTLRSRRGVVASPLLPVLSASHSKTPEIQHKRNTCHTDTPPSATSYTHHTQHTLYVHHTTYTLHTIQICHIMYHTPHIPHYTPYTPHILINVCTHTTHHLSPTTHKYTTHVHTL